MKLLQNHSLKNYNTFGVDISSKYFAEIFSEFELVELLNAKTYSFQKKLILGGGSNILFTKDFDGIIIKTSISGINIVEESENEVIIESGAGTIWDDLVAYCVEKNFGGIENLTSIPGSVGAAPIQNIGAYGQELSDTFLSLEGILIENGEKKIFLKDDCKFSYRKSVFKEELKNKIIITSVRLRLSKNAKVNATYKALVEYFSSKEKTNPTIKDVRKAVAEIRQSRLPDPKVIGNAGSFFKNPEISFETFNRIKSEFQDIVNFSAEKEKVKIAAGWLIEKCGWKGKRVGDVGTSPENALVICNFGKATGNEIMEFAIRLKEEVTNKFGITLQEEVNIL